MFPLGFRGREHGSKGGDLNPPLFYGLPSVGVRDGGARHWHCPGRAKT